MYEELIKRLRVTCGSCKLWDGYKCCLKGECSAQKSLQAADAIEELQSTIKGFKAQTDLAIVEEKGRTLLKIIPKWIPVTERLPEIHTNVLVVDKAHDMAVGSLEKIWDGIVWVCPFSAVDDDDCKITHWMPLPEPPESECE